MKVIFEIFDKWKLGLFKFKGDVELIDILAIIKESYLNKKYRSLSHNIFDFRECNFVFNVHDVNKINLLVEENSNLTLHVKTGLLVSEPKVTALSMIYSTDFKIQKIVKVTSTTKHLISILDLQIYEDELESLLENM